MTRQKYTAKREQKKKNVNFCNFTIFTPKIPVFVGLTPLLYKGKKQTIKQSNKYLPTPRRTKVQKYNIFT